jgi:hypothetical protein
MSKPGGMTNKQRAVLPRQDDYACLNNKLFLFLFADGQRQEGHQEEAGTFAGGEKEKEEGSGEREKEQQEEGSLLKGKEGEETGSQQQCQQQRRQ